MIGGKIIVVGGTTEPTPMPGCASLDPANLTAGWTACQNMPTTGQHHMAGGTDGSQLFVWGGRGYAALDFHARFNPISNQWSTPAAGKLPVGRAGRIAPKGDRCRLSTPAISGPEDTSSAPPPST